MNKTGSIQPGMSVAVMGLGITGQAAVRYGLAHGATVLVSDSRPKEQLLSEAGEFLKSTGVLWEAGGHTYSFLSQADLVIVSPGIHNDHPVLVQLAASGVKLTGELGVAASEVDVPVVAITGTNGKTTVTSLVGAIIATAGNKVFVGGNIGTPLLDYLCSQDKAEFLVLEVSSFQLMLAGEFTPDVAVLLNITPDHLDRHKTLEEYGQAKMQLFKHQNAEQQAIYSNDDVLCRTLCKQLPAKKLSFGHDAECRATIVGNSVVLQHEVDGENIVYDLKNTSFSGSIGACNAAAAILAAHCLGIEQDAIRKTLSKFTPPPHRLQLVRQLDGVKYINDSKATNTGAVIAALEQLDGKVILLAGGREKGEDYSLMSAAIQKKVHQMIVMGEAASSMESTLQNVVSIARVQTMEEGVQLAAEIARSGDTVLLSPACASFDMFDSYGHRGDIFAGAVNGLVSQKTPVFGDNGS